jgi:hypothetical protein
LHEDVEHLALSIDGAPEIGLFLSKPGEEEYSEYPRLLGMFDKF